MYNVQIINRVGWDGFIRSPDPAELGWKDTLRVSPLEDTIVALRPVAVTLPFVIPDKVRAIDPTMPLGRELIGPSGGFFDPQANPVTILNHLVNLGWEYVWHCHILAHEEMDMMHSQAIAVSQPATAPDTLMSGEVVNATTNTTAVYLAWMDRSTNETDWFIQRANVSDTGNWTDFMKVPSYTTGETGDWAMAIDGSFPADTTPNYSYRVIASNVVGDDTVYAGSVGFPTLSRNSTPSGINVSQSIAPPASADFTYTPGSGDAPLRVNFTDASAGATGWDWDFGDGNFASDNGQQNPSHVYEIPGTYTVTLTAMNTGGNATSAPSTVIVTRAPAPPTPIASFTNVTPREGVAPLTVTFNADASVSIPAVWATWRWGFGDGTFTSEKNPTHTYVNAGNYTVNLTATNLGGSNLLTRPLFVNVTAPPPTTDKIGVTNGITWYLDSNGNGVLDGPLVDQQAFFGIAGYTPVVGDWNGDLRTEIGVTNGVDWFLDTNGNGTWDGAPVDQHGFFGIPGWTPVVGDWNGDGKTKIGVTNAVYWYLDDSGNGAWDGPVIDKAPFFGISGYTPVTGKWQ
jgi:PKD repeat protein